MLVGGLGEGGRRGGPAVGLVAPLLLAALPAGQPGIFFRVAVEAVSRSDLRTARKGGVLAREAVHTQAVKAVSQAGRQCKGIQGKGS